ncbi:MAG: response regulator [Phormidesmis priestleyi]|uniref:Response regulator n=1 Tax=Phormidesmis priestleyi TaxID=268141 RepID=A0A2W4WZI7_9CYAN|nr:MAG: response regulator [Phormidesmis priestleyi]
MPSQAIIQVLDEKIQIHKQNQFTGIVHIGTAKSPYWSIYFHLGRIVWAHSQLHPVRRWYRQLVKHCPQAIKAATTGSDAQNQAKDQINYADLCYSKLVNDVHEGVLDRIALAKAVEDYLCEVLFDVAHQSSLLFLYARPPLTLIDVEKRFSNSLFLFVRSEQACQQAQYDWQAWQRAGLSKCFPNLAPVIRQPEALKQCMSKPIYEHFSSHINGGQTFRDIAAHLNQPLLPLTRQIVPYISKGMIGLVRVDDLGEVQVPTETKPSVADAPLIIYIDDSPRDSKLMGEILQDAGFRFHTIQESTHALPLLIEHKPQLIFLDLIMPVANGYEICSQLRRVSLFKDIPIVIVTSNDTLSDRVRAKMVGASGFLSKPIRREKILQAVHKLLHPRELGGTQSKPANADRTSLAKASVNL